MPLLPSNDAVHVSVSALLKLIANTGKFSLKRGRIKSLHSGIDRSAFKGRGMEFDESRPYQPGDDVRHLDWRVTARSGKVYSKIFREERERPVYFWVDQRWSMKFATRGKFKSVIAAEIACLLAANAVEQGDRVGGVIFSDHSHDELKPCSGRAAMLDLLRQLSLHGGGMKNVPVQDAALAGRHAVLRLCRLIKHGSLVFLISDFRNFDALLESRLPQLSRHNDLVLVLIYDPLETDLPPAGRYQVSDGSRNMTLDTGNRRRARNYRERFIARRTRVRELATVCGALYLSCSTGDDTYTVIKQELMNRGSGRLTLA